MALFALASAPFAATPARATLGGTTKRVSLDAGQDDPDGISLNRSLSADGSLIAFSSEATDLVPGDVNLLRDVFLRDRAGGANVLVSAGIGGASANGRSGEPAISADGRFVAFTSEAANLVAGDTNNSADVFVRDLVAGTTKRVSLGAGGVQGNQASQHPAISGDGKYVAFTSRATNLVSGDSNGRSDVFVRNIVTKTTTRVSLASGGAQGNGNSLRPTISADGRAVAFESLATNFTPTTTSGFSNTFVRVGVSGPPVASTPTVLVSRNLKGKPANADSFLAGVSADATKVVYTSRASNIATTNIVGDANVAADVFEFDIASLTAVRVSVNEFGGDAAGDSFSRAPSNDGRYVAFMSTANDLVSGTGTQATVQDVFLRDLLTGRTILLSYDDNDQKADGNSYKPAITTDGGTVAWRSDAADLVSSDGNTLSDVFVRSTSIVSVGSQSVPEGDTCLHNARFTISLSVPSEDTISVDYATADVTATSGMDYTPTSGTATFVPGTAAVSVSVPVTCDTSIEGTETFTLSLSNLVGISALMGNTVGSGSIQNDDPNSTTAVWRIGAVTVIEGDQGARNARVQVVLSKPKANAVTVDYTTVGGSATSGVDFTPVTGTLTMPAGVTGMPINVPINPDQDPESTETFTVVLSNPQPSAIAVAQGTGTVTILDDDPPYV